jgi:fructokinase
MLYGTIEAGGTKMIAGIADEDARIQRSASFPTLAPDETLADLAGFFKGSGITALGIATFGPADVHSTSPRYGTILNTPKIPWQGYPLLQKLQEALSVPCACDTDVNAAVLAEAEMGAAQGLLNCLYLTVGTGIGGGLYCEGSLVHGMLHPEWGHLTLVRHPDDTLERGVCPFHPACAEGLASGPSLAARWGTAAGSLPPGHPAWEIEAFYLAQVCVAAILTVSVQRILLGGGVMGQEQLFPMIRRMVREQLAGYLKTDELDDMESFICRPALYPVSGLIGGALLAKAAVKKQVTQ